MLLENSASHVNHAHPVGHRHKAAPAAPVHGNLPINNVAQAQARIRKADPAHGITTPHDKKAAHHGKKAAHRKAKAADLHAHPWECAAPDLDPAAHLAVHAPDKAQADRSANKPPKRRCHRSPNQGPRSPRPCPSSARNKRQANPH